MKILLAAMVATVLWSTASSAQDVRLEPDALLGSEIKKHSNRQAVLNALARMIRLKGWRCDSISVARKFLFSRGFTVICNRFAYEYEVKDRGGRWVVTLE